MKYFIRTLGCAMNISDSERLASFLEDRNFAAAKNIESAELIIFNTCGIRQAAENRVYSFINNIRKTNKDSKIIVTGCLAHREDVQKRLQNKVDLFFSISDFGKFENWIFENLLEIENCDLKIKARNNITSKESLAYLSINPQHTNTFQALVPIMTGCNNFCSYCVVPYARGREVSRESKEILSEIRLLVENGYKHITLLGQNVNSYQSKKTDFAKLLKSIDKISGSFWVSFVSSHPKDMDDDLIGTITKLEKVCEWVHLPVQAGDDKILQKMNRKYTQRHFLGRIEKIKSAFEKNKPGVQYSISSDIIVGFPSETKKQFSQSKLVMQKARFDMVFFGQFSPRPGTAAWKMKDNISNEEKEKREFFLNEILKKTAAENNKKYIGKILDALIEKEKNGSYFGKTRTMKNVKITSRKKNLIGTFVKIKITKANIWNLEGVLQ